YYISHLGMNEITADDLSVSGDTTLDNLKVSGQTMINALILPNGAHDGYILTSDPNGAVSWKPNIDNLAMALEM
ncbi:hypothetical protein, partial [Clostridium sp.]|uniref:hypothetical protein n=1 Tax=Clostridium sp. TaxID=1506 RepID=UPI0028473902